MAMVGSIYLTPRQKQIYDLIMPVLTNPEIAEELGISVRMVRGHITLLLRKFGVANRVQLIAASKR